MGQDTVSKNIIEGIRIYDREEKYRCWNASSYEIPASEFHFWNLDGFPEDGWEFFLLKNGMVYFKHYECYPEYSVIGYWVENDCNPPAWIEDIYNTDPDNYSQATNDTTWACLYDNLEAFWADSAMTYAEKVLSCNLTKKIMGLYHKNLANKTAFTATKISWYIASDEFNQKTDTPEKYIHWMQLHHGCDIKSSCNLWFDVYYPRHAITGQKIKVIAKNNSITFIQKWVHGDHGLTKRLLKELFGEI